MKILTSITAVTLLLLNCRAQIRNEDQIREDAHLHYSDPVLLERNSKELIKRLKASTSPSDRNNLAVAYARIGRIDLCYAILDRLAADHTIDRTGLLNLARFKFLSGELDGAQEAYHRLISRDFIPEREYAIFLDRLLREGRGEEAAMFQRALLLSNRNPTQAALWLGAHYAGIHQYGSAINYYEKVLEIDPKNRTALFSIGYIYYSGGDYARASVYLDHARRFGSTEPHLNHLLAYSLYKNDLARDALDLLERSPSDELRTASLHLEILSLLKFGTDPGHILKRLSVEDRRMLLTEMYGKGGSEEGSESQTLDDPNSNEIETDADFDEDRLLRTVEMIQSDLLDLR